MTKLYPSLLSVDFLDLQHELKRLEEAGVDGVHFDVMDGQFVPNMCVTWFTNIRCSKKRHNITYRRTFDD